MSENMKSHHSKSKVSVSNLVMVDKREFRTNYREPSYSSGRS